MSPTTKPPSAIEATAEKRPHAWPFRAVSTGSIASLSTYLGILLPVIAPLIAVRAVLVSPLVHHAGAPFLYLLGVYAMAVAYGLYYLLRQRRYDGLWIFGAVFCFFYVAFMLWQTYYAVLTARSSDWGTRPATAGMGVTPDSDPVLVEAPA